MTQTHASQSEFAKKIKELTDGIQKERSDEESTLETAIDAEENKQQRTRSDNQQSIRLTQKKLQAAQKRTGELGQQWAVKEQTNLQLATELGKKQNEAAVLLAGRRRYPFNALPVSQIMKNFIC